MGTSNLSAHRVLIEEGGGTKDVTAFCFSTPQAAETASNLVPHWKVLAKSALECTIAYDSGCILMECPANGELKLITTPLAIPYTEQPNQPSSPGDHDLQATRFPPS